MGRRNLLEVHAAERLKMPEEWRVAKYDTLEGDDGSVFLKLTGAVYPERLKSGPRKGETNWRRPQSGTQKTAIFTRTEQRAFEMEWERRTGSCAECVGEGKTLASMHRDTGATYRDCFRCRGTGKSPLAEVKR